MSIMEQLTALSGMSRQADAFFREFADMLHITKASAARLEQIERRLEGIEKWQRQQQGITRQPQRPPP